MSISSASSVAAPQSAIAGTDVARQNGKAHIRQTEALARQADARLQLNASIVQTSLTVSVNTQNEPLALLLKTAIENLNEALKPEFGDNALQNAQGQDNTPEGTAGRIVSLSTGFFDAFKQQHAGADDGETLKDFMATIRRGVEQGFKEARQILKGLNVLNGDIAVNIDKTYELVQKGYVDFEAARADTAPAETASS
jgi:hypothetical protein